MLIAEVDLFYLGLLQADISDMRVLTPANPCKCEIARTGRNRTVLTQDKASTYDATPASPVSKASSMGQGPSEPDPHS